MTTTIKDPTSYTERLMAFNLSRPRHWPRLQLGLVRKTNATTTANQPSWGWYEVFPLGDVVAHWGEFDPLSKSDVSEWNKKASEL
jgi:hypothetical protein